MGPCTRSRAALTNLSVDHVFNAARSAHDNVRSSIQLLHVDGDGCSANTGVTFNLEGLDISYTVFSQLNVV